MYRVAGIAVENAAYAFDKLYSYAVPREMEGSIVPGVRVAVPFGGGNRRRTGVVVEVASAGDREGLKPVTDVLDAVPLLDEEGLLLLRYLKENTFCTWFDALRLLIPAGIGVVHRTEYRYGNVFPGQVFEPVQGEILAFLKGKKRAVEQGALCERFGIEAKGPELTGLLELGAVLRMEKSRQRIQDDKVLMARLSDERGAPLTAKQRLVVAFLEDVSSASVKEICYYAGVTRAVVDALERKGVVEYFDAVRLRSPFSGGSEIKAERVELSEAQQAAFEELRGMAEEERPQSALLYGVTGSGKTQVFLRLIEHVIGRGKSAVVLVPEISLTAQMVEGFRSRFGDKVAVLHSALSLGERMDEWKRIRDGSATIVVGTRSAVFAPVVNLGLIVIDEEQEHTYQSDKSPRFHARDVALRRCGHHRALLVLSSATPSIESFYYAKQERYRLVRLEERYNRQQLPDVYIVDMRDQENVSQTPGLSHRLLEEMRYNLEHGEQSILLLNRRGYSTLIKCGGCGEVAECPSCSVAMTYHNANDSLICHYCGYSRTRVTVCENCGSELIRYTGSGTQKLQEDLEAVFPDARILRVDMDTTMAKFSHEKLFGAFAAREYDIMIGTQMVAKGLNFPDVTLVGVLNADQSLYAGDFRGFERSFSLLTQVVGRCGRGGKKGRAFVQTFSPESPIIALAAEQDYLAFYAQEILSRKHHLYPPFCVLAGVGFVGEDLEQVRIWSGRYLERFRQVAASRYPQLPVRVLGPVPAEILKTANKYRFRLILKCRNDGATRALLAEMLEWFCKECRTVTAYVDMHYGR